MYCIYIYVCVYGAMDDDLMGKLTNSYDTMGYC